LLLVTLLVVALAWAALTKADLVVRAPGRVRPISDPQKVFPAITTHVDGRVVEVKFQQGDQVRQGDVLLRLDTARVDNAIGSRRQTIEAAEQELAKLDALTALVKQQFATAKAKAQAELIQATDDLARCQERRAAEIQMAKTKLGTARDKLMRIQKLIQRNVATEESLVEATASVEQAQEELRKAEVTLDEGKVAVLRQALELVDRELASRNAELEAQQAVKRGEIGAARKELANLELDLEWSVLRAPFDGIVVSDDVHVGDVLEPGKPAVEVAPQRGFCFEVLVASGDVGELGEGMPARIKFDAYDYQKHGTLAGTLSFVSPDSKVSDGQQGPPGVNFLVCIELAGDEVGDADLRRLIKLGMGGSAEIITQSESLLAILVKKIRHSISLG
jgi:HlyD family secretion protein